MNWLIENINWVTFVGAFIVLVGELLERRERDGKPKQAKYLPIVIFVGAIIVLSRVHFLLELIRKEKIEKFIMWLPEEIVFVM
jgi:hypothetical protein